MKPDLSPVRGMLLIPPRKIGTLRAPMNNAPSTSGVLMHQISLVNRLACFFVLAFALTPVTMSLAAPIKASSDIPARREFPLNEKVEPCENFHQYVCSNVESSFKLRDDRRSHTFSFNDSAERLLEQKKKFLKDLSQAKPKDTFITELLKNPRASQMKVNYLTCMNRKAQKKGELDFLKEIQQKLNPVKTMSELVLLDRDYKIRGYDSLYGDFMNANVDNPDIYDVVFMGSLMTLPDHDYYENAALMKDYRNLLKDYFVILNQKMSEGDAYKKADRLLKLENEFLKVYPKRAERRQRWTQKRYVTYEEIQKKYPAFQLAPVLSDFTAKNPLRTPIPESLDFIHELLTKEENLDVLKDIMSVHLGYGLIDESYPEFFKKKFAFQKKYFGGPEKRAALDERCTRGIMSTFEREIDWALIDKTFPAFPDEKLLEVSEKIRKSIVAGLEDNKWLSRQSKKGALSKIKNARLMLIKPRTDAEWDFQPLVDYELNEPLKNSEKLAAANRVRYLEKLKKPIDKNVWIMSPLTVNASYMPSQNTFTMPIGILQYPFFDDQMSLIENLGAVGAVVGHELGHAIDDQGSKYDDKGQLREWMSEKDRLELGRRGARMIEQFNKTGHKGDLTLGENIGDLVGLTFAFNAAFPKGKGTIEDKQKLFIAYARVWCGVSRPQFEELQMKTGVHSLGRFRINEQVKHQPGFAEAFQCKPGSPMSLPPEERVSIW